MKSDAEKVIPLPSGATIVFRAWGEREPGGFDVAEFTAEPRYKGPRPHVHYKHEEFFYGLEGEFELLLGSEVQRLHPGSSIHVPPGVVHAFRNPESVRARCLLIASPAGLDRYFEEKAALAARDEAGDTSLSELRLKYDTHEQDVAGW